MTNPNYDVLIEDIRAKLCAEYEASEELKAEFPTADDYAAYRLATGGAPGVLRIYRGRSEDAANEAAIARAELL